MIFSETHSSIKVLNFPDLTVFPGQAFVYPFPKINSKYQVQESGVTFLPSWLAFDKEKNQLLGVASLEDVGRVYFIEVKTEEKDSLPFLQIFKITVESAEKESLYDLLDFEEGNLKIKDYHSQHNKVIFCKKEKPITSASIILHQNLDDDGLTPFAKVNILKKFARHYGLPLKAVKLLGNKNFLNSKKEKNTVLIAGPGDFISHREKMGEENNVVLSWTVGCGNVQKYHLQTLQRIESEAKEGILKQIIGNRIISWHVTNKKMKDDGRRRRNIFSHHYATATPTITIYPQTVYPDSFPVFTHSPRGKGPHRNKTKKVSKTTNHFSIITQKPLDKDDFKLIKPLHEIKVFIGEVLILNLDHTYFNKPLKSLQLTSVNGDLLRTTSWLKLNSSSQLGVASFYGLPLPEHEGQQEYLIKATSLSLQEISIPLLIQVIPSKAYLSPLLFNILLANYNIDRFINDVDSRMDIAWRISTSFGDSAPSDVLLCHMGRGSLDLTWVNKTLLNLFLQSAECPSIKSRSVAELFIDERGHLSQEFQHNMRAFNLTYAELNVSGPCLNFFGRRIPNHIGGLQVVKRPSKTLWSFSTSYSHITEKEKEVIYKPEIMDHHDNQKFMLKQILIPILIILGILVLAFLTACIAFIMRNQKKEKLKSEELIKKGTPIIFAHELDDQPPIPSTKRPLTSMEQRSPKPPNYRQHINNTSFGGKKASFVSS